MDATEDVAVFVYGTLTDPERVERVLDGADGPVEWRELGSATLDGLHRVDGRYPTLAPGGTVDGQLLALDAAGLDRLDAYEGVDAGLYVRVSIPMPDGEAWVYVGDPDRLGVDEPAPWPAGPSFDTRVERYVASHDVRVRHSN